MKKLLVYSYFFFPEENANTNVLMPLLEELKKKYTVEIYTSRFSTDLPQKDEHQGMTIYRKKIVSGRIIRRIMGIYDLKQDQIFGFGKSIKKWIWRCFHKVITRTELEKLLWEYPVQRYLLQRMKKGKYDALITVSAPIITQYEVLDVARKGFLKKRHIKWFPYFTDPHATFIGHREQFDDLIQREMDIYMLADKVFVTRELYENNKEQMLGKYLYKTISVDYANLRPVPNTFSIDYLEHGKINCVYTGSLFSIHVRNPEYFYKVAQVCSDDFRFHIVCYVADDANLELRKKYIDGNPKIIWHDRATMAECQSLMCQANVLINFGNLCTNQTPSKVFDYISTGKPIVNFCSLENDTAKRYLKHYPLHLNIFCKNEFDLKDTTLFEQFCVTNKDTMLPFEEVQEKYKNFTPEIAASNFIREIEKSFAIV